MRRDRSLTIRIFALGIVWLCVTVRGGDRIVFTGPTNEVTAPAQPENPRIPAARNGSRLSFAPESPQLAIPYARPPVPMESRKPTKRSFFDEPALFSDPEEMRKSRERNDEPMVGTARYFESFQPREERALSPVRQYDWAPEEAEKLSNRSRESSPRHYESGLFSRNSDEPRVGIFGTRNDLNFENAPNRENELSRATQERQLEFERMLNPSLPNLNSRLPDRGLVQGVSPSQAAKPPVPFVAPPEPVRPSLDPMQAFNEQQQRRFAGPTMEDINRRVLGTPEVRRPTAIDSPDRRTPLMRQPTLQEIPARRF